MASDSTKASMLKESLVESLEVVKYCICFKKTGSHWGEFDTGGCLGYL